MRGPARWQERWQSALRQAESVPLWHELERVIIDITPKVDKKAPLGKAIHYWTRQQPSLRAFLDDGRFPIAFLGPPDKCGEFVGEDLVGGLDEGVIAVEFLGMQLRANVPHQVDHQPFVAAREDRRARRRR